MLKKILIPLMLLLIITTPSYANNTADYLKTKEHIKSAGATNVVVQLEKPVTIFVKGIRYNGEYDNYGFVIDFMLDDETKLKYTVNSSRKETKYNKKITIDKVVYRYPGGGNVTGYLYGRRVFMPEYLSIYVADPDSMVDFAIVDTTHDTATLKITNDLDYKSLSVLIDGSPYTTLNVNSNQHVIKMLKPSKKYEITVKAVTQSGEVSEASYTFVTKDPPPPPKLQQDHVRAQNITDKSAELYVAALIPNYDHIYIYDKDDKLIHQQPITGMVAYRHQLKDLQQDRSYKYFVQVKHGSVLSDKLQIAFKTPRTETEVGNLQGRNEGESVVLSWINPDYADFKWVKIYRKKEDEPAPKAKFFGFGMMTASAAAGYNPMFKFDGQNWKDLTVEAATTYEYKVTTLDATESNETDGKTVKVKTLPPKIVGSELTGGEDKKNPDGTPELDGDGNPIKEDFIIKWSTPTKGKVKVMVGGQEYTTVSASQQQVTIPYNSMKYDGLGNPQVQLIPIADNGTTGQTAQPPPPSGGTIGNVVGSGASAAVNANNLLQISLGLLAKVALFILLGMAFMLVPKLIRIIYYAVTGKDSYMENNNEENKKVRVIEKRR